ncbi:MAG: DUF4271 domain-containing protein [Bacteroidales bacterium]|nr:DUF4271 domain-containing protein [Bacteroidales bacterium]
MVIEDNPQTAETIVQDTTGNNSINLVSVKDTITITEEGFEGIPLQHNSSYNNSLLILLIFSLFVIFVAISRKKISLRTLTSNKEESKEEVRHTIIDLTIRITLCTISVILYAIAILYLSSENIYKHQLTVQPIVKIGGIVALYIIIQQIILWLVGKIFFTPLETKQFLKDNITYYTLPSIIFTPIIILYILTSWHTNSLIFIALVIVWGIRLIFIIRNIKIFKHNIATSFNIILYLCIVEIMPIAIIYKWTLNI